MPETPTLETQPETESISPRDQQRKALGDLVKLATESAATEAEIEKRLQDSLVTAEKQYENLLWEIDQKAKTIREQIEQKHKEKLAQIDEAYAAEAKKLKQSAEATRRRIDHDHHQVEADVKDKFQQASWLAESVYDGTIQQIDLEAKQAKETVQTRIDDADQLFNQAIKTMINFGQLPPQASDAAEGAEPAESKSYEQALADAEMSLKSLGWLALPRFFTGVSPFIILMFLCGGAAAAAYFYTAKPNPDWKIVGAAGGGIFLIMLVLGVLLKRKSRRQLDAAMAQADQAILQLRLTAQAEYRRKTHELETRRAQAEQIRKAEVDKARAELQPLMQQSTRRKESALVNAQAEQGKLASRLDQQREAARNEAEVAHRKQSIEFEHRVEREQKIAIDRRDMKKADASFTHENDRKALEQRLADGLINTRAPATSDGHEIATDWNEKSWAGWSPPKTFASAIPFGTLSVDLKHFAQSAVGETLLKIRLPEQFQMPATLQFPNHGSMLLQTDRAGRDEGIRTMQMVMTRLLTCLPAGRARFTIIDPVGLGQNFAGFMRLADYDENLVGTRIWTEQDQINQRLANLSEHMETVIQKYLRNEFATIDDYNAQAGELAEPYRFLVIADFPQSFQIESIRRLTSIVSSGARCGVYVLMLRDKRVPLPMGAHIEDIEGQCLNLVYDGEKFVWKDPVFQQFPLKLDPPPSEEFLTKLMDRVGQGAKEANRVEVSFDTIAPKPDEFWSLSCADELRVPIGRMGATRLQMLRLGKGVAQHALVAGKTGSGKSTLLNALVTNLSMWYSPEEVEFFLIDFKKGVEFKAYATSGLPHARAIAVESDREFGLSVLQRLDAELTRRGDLFRKAGVQDLPSYRRLDNALSMPRTLLIIDEFQEFFSEDDKLAQDASVLLDRLVRQGRAFGIHVMLGSQTIGGTSGLARSTIGQMAVQIALQCSEADSQMILGDNNSAARLLSRPGEAIYNDAGGLVEGNSPFQIAWLPDEKREAFLHKVKRTADERGIDRPEAIVFEGNQPADITKNHRLSKLVPAKLDGARTWTNPKVPTAWLGEPVAIKDPTAVNFRRQSGANAIIVGQQDEAATALIAAMMTGVAAQLSPKDAKFVLLDGTPADSALAGTLQKVKAAIPHDVKEVEYRLVPESIAELHAEFVRRRDGDESHPPAIFLLIHGLQRTGIRKSEDSFSFSMEETEKKPQPDKQLAELLREGPTFGIHTVTWVDTPASIERTFDRSMLREFDHRVLFQMSATDSSLLVDSPIANKLGQNRALYHSEEQGVMEKFRPYGLPTTPWLGRVNESLKA